MINEERIGLLIASKMFTKNISIQELAEQTGYTVEDIEKILLGKYELTIRTLSKLDVILDDEILCHVFSPKVLDKVDDMNGHSMDGVMTFKVDENTKFVNIPMC